jgi:hypothetical protein
VAERNSLPKHSPLRSPENTQAEAISHLQLSTLDFLGSLLPRVVTSVNMEVVGAIASFIAIGQAIEKGPKVFRALRGIVNPSKEVEELADEVSLVFAAPCFLWSQQR